jgi:tRNA (guanine-N7-)-methyltransferase
LRTYGRRKGPRLSARKQTLLDGLLPRLRLDLDAPPPIPLTGLFDPPVESVALEIGFGAGEHLVQQASAYPACGFIGCEVYVNGVAALLGQIEEAGLRNIRVHDGDARPVLDWLPEAALSRVFVLFPDPWPKKRHYKRRLISPETLARLARVMRRGAELRIASDIPDYVRTALAAARESGDFEWRAERPSDWRVRPDDWPQTRYERKALAAGRTCSYLSFIRC